MADRQAVPALPHPIPFVDLQAQRESIAKRISAAIERVLEHGNYIMGPEVRALEERLADFVGVRHAVTCASGTDALLLPLLALGVGPGSAVFCPAFTFAATAEVVALVGATPVFVDILPDTFNIDNESLEQALEVARKAALKPAGIIPVDLFGQTADYDAVTAIADDNGLFIIEDAAQALGATYNGRRAGQFGDFGATSFFPTKPLGCYGDGGAVFTDDDAAAATLRSLRSHGQGSNKYENVRIGVNGRMDTIQAAVLLEKLEIFVDEISARQRVAERYNAALADLVTVPSIPEGMQSVWAQYTIAVDDRDRLAEALKTQGVPTAVYYPRPLHLQPAYQKYPRAPGGLPVSERLSSQVLSLPMHPYLDELTQDLIIGAISYALGR